MQYFLLSVLLRDLWRDNVRREESFEHMQYIKQDWGVGRIMAMD